MMAVVRKGRGRRGKRGRREVVLLTRRKKVTLTQD